MIKLYGVYRSRALRPLWVLAECEAPFTHVPVIQAYRLAQPIPVDAPLNTASASYLAVNPQGQVPAMEEDGLVLTESLAITQYLAKCHGGTLGPANLAEDALIEQWSLFAATAIEGPALEIQFALQADAAAPEARAAASLNAERLRRPLRRLARHLDVHSWLVGDRFTVADINLAECLRYAQGHTALMEEFPSVSGWLSRCQSRPAFQKIWALREAEPA